jgi:hypothetical protein
MNASTSTDDMIIPDEAKFRHLAIRIAYGKEDYLPTVRRILKSVKFQAPWADNALATGCDGSAARSIGLTCHFAGPVEPQISLVNPACRV